MTTEKNFLGINLLNGKHDKDYKRASYLSRVFGIFYEDLIKYCWAEEGYSLRGRPSVYDMDDNYLKKTYDYMVEKNGKKFIVEAKCYVAYQNFTEMELTTRLLDKYATPSDNSAFQFFLKLGSEKELFNKYKFYYSDVKTGEKNPFSPDGKILIWARVTKDEDEKKRIKEKYNFSDLLSVEEMINKNKKNDAYKYIQDLKNWTDDLFKKLLEK